MSTSDPGTDPASGSPSSNSSKFVLIGVVVAVLLAVFLIAGPCSGNDCVDRWVDENSSQFGENARDDSTEIGARVKAVGEQLCKSGAIS